MVSQTESSLQLFRFVLLALEYINAAMYKINEGLKGINYLTPEIEKYLFK